MKIENVILIAGAYLLFMQMRKKDTYAGEHYPTNSDFDQYQTEPLEPNFPTTQVGSREPNFPTTQVGSRYNGQGPKTTGVSGKTVVHHYEYLPFQNSDNVWSQNPCINQIASKARFQF